MAIETRAASSASSLRSGDALAAAAASFVGPRPATARRKLDRAAARPEVAKVVGHPHAVSKELFRGALVREQKRADRSNLPIVLLLLTKREDFGFDTDFVWSAAIEALAAVKQDTDVLGWFEQGRTIGVIFPEIEGAAATVALDLQTRARLELTKRLGTQTAATFSLQPHIHSEPVAGAAPETVGVVPLPLQQEPKDARSTIYKALKRGLDIAGGLVLLLLLTPLMLLVAALVKLTSPGPVFFKQVRIGENMCPFTMLKFRSMHVNSNNDIHKEFVSSFIKASGKTDSVGQDGFFKIAKDPRVTRIGNFIRKTSIDELPQFINVLRGDMSLVGPRPALQYEVEQYKRWHRRRVLEAKPGITGLWQVTGRSRTTFDEMVRLDLRYAKSRSLRTDIKILLATPKAVIAGKGAC